MTGYKKFTNLIGDFVGKFTKKAFCTFIFHQEVLVGPQNRTVVSNDNFLRANLIGDFVGYTNIPSFEDFYLVIPRQVCLLH